MYIYIYIYISFSLFLLSLCFFSFSLSLSLSLYIYIYKDLACLATLMSCDTTKQSVDDNIYIHIYKVWIACSTKG